MKDARESCEWWEDDDLPEKGLHLMATTRKRVLSVNLEPGEIVVRTRHWWDQQLLCLQVHPRKGWACVRLGTRHWWLQRKDARA